jgi:hypothetical protein
MSDYGESYLAHVDKHIDSAYVKVKLGSLSVQSKDRKDVEDDRPIRRQFVLYSPR